MIAILLGLVGGGVPKASDKFRNEIVFSAKKFDDRQEHHVTESARAQLYFLDPVSERYHAIPTGADNVGCLAALSGDRILYIKHDNASKSNALIELNLSTNKRSRITSLPAGTVWHLKASQDGNSVIVFFDDDTCYCFRRATALKNNKTVLSGGNIVDASYDAQDDSYWVLKSPGDHLRRLSHGFWTTVALSRDLDLIGTACCMTPAGSLKVFAYRRYENSTEYKLLSYGSSGKRESSIHVMPLVPDQGYGDYAREAGEGDSMVGSHMRAAPRQGHLIGTITYEMSSGAQAFTWDLDIEHKKMSPLCFGWWFGSIPKVGELALLSKWTEGYHQGGLLYRMVVKSKSAALSPVRISGSHLDVIDAAVCN